MGMETARGRRAWLDDGAMKRALAIAAGLVLLAAVLAVAVRSTHAGRHVGLHSTGGAADGSVPGDAALLPGDTDGSPGTVSDGLTTTTTNATTASGTSHSGTSGPATSSAEGAPSPAIADGPGSGLDPSVRSASWPMFHGSAQHTGMTDVIGPSSAKVRWSYAPGDAYTAARSSPVVGANGTVYVARGSATNPQCQSPAADSCGSVVDALRPDGSRIWEWTDTTEGIVRSVPAVAPDGTVYVPFDFGPHAGDLVAIAPTGTTKWKVSGISSGPPTIGPDGTLYLEDSMSRVEALRPSDGQVLWQFSGAPGGIGARGTPALSADGTTVYAGSGGGVVYALSTTGQLRWQAPSTGPAIVNAPAVGPGGTIYVATAGVNGDTPSDIDAFSPTGALEWRYTADGAFETTPAVQPDGVVIAGDDVGTVVAVAPGGTLAWSYHASGADGTNGFYDSSAALGADGVAYVQNGLHTVFALKSGHAVWTASVGGDGSPALAGDGVLYVAGTGGLQAFHS
ncbi:MAG: PQQ-like beta-propeller repeat protein [Acidimicrobiia bacterium]|nr:PQQ-like beta-propeller repeat protein [Acidimicrobiia bacterium]